MDDIIVRGDDLEKIKQLKQWYFQGIEVSLLRNGIFVSQYKYTLDLFKETEMLRYKPRETLIEWNYRLSDSFESIVID